MAKNLIQIAELDDAITTELVRYSEEVENKVYRAGYKAIKDLERRTIDTAPFNERAHREHFRESIATASERRRFGESVHTWYVKAPNYRLTHLLVHGHATRNGGRVPPDPFLVNALDPVLKQYEEDVEEAIKNGR